MEESKPGQNIEIDNIQAISNESQVNKTRGLKRNWTKIALITISAVVVLALILAAYYFGTTKQVNDSQQYDQRVATSQTPSPTPIPESTTTPTPQVETKHYEGAGGIFSFDYPSDWEVQAEANGGNPDDATYSVRLLIVKGTSEALRMNYNSWSRIGPSPSENSLNCLNIPIGSRQDATYSNEEGSTYSGVYTLASPEAHWGIAFSFEGNDGNDAVRRQVLKSFEGIKNDAEFYPGIYCDPAKTQEG